MWSTLAGSHTFQPDQWRGGGSTQGNYYAGYVEYSVQYAPLITPFEVPPW